MKQPPTDIVLGGHPTAPVRALPLLLAPMSGILLAALGHSVLTTALPTVVGELGAMRHLPWVVATGLVMTAASVPLYGRLSDEFGRKRLFQIAVIAFVIGTVLSGFAGNMPQLLVARAVQGLGAGGLITLPAAIVADSFSPRERGRYLGYTVSMHVLASLLGPLVGGVLVDQVSWRLALAAPAPVGVYALLLSTRVPDRARSERTPVDLTSAGLLAGAIVAIMVAVLAAGHVGWTAAPTLGAAALAGAALTGYTARARRTDDAVIPPALLRNPTVAVTSIVGLLLGVSLHGSLTFLPVYLQIGLGTSASRSGFLMLPLMVGLILTSIPAGRRVTRVGRYRSLPLTGTALLAVGYLVLSQVGVGTPPLVVMALVTVLGAAIGLAMPTMLIAVQAAVPAHRIGVATATQQLSKSFGAALGVSALGGVWNSRLSTLLTARLSPDLGLDPETIVASPQAIAALAPDVADAVRSAVAGATAWTFLVIGVLAVLNHAISWRLREMS